jgi:inosine/xanthosine triphosphate pyrophosphatase family protein
VKPLTFATGNANKLAEVKAILGDSIPLTSKAIDRTLPPTARAHFKNLIQMAIFSARAAGRAR